MHQLTAILGSTPLWVLQHVPAMVFVFCFGACVGSFLNVVVHRLPAGMSVVSPPSRCPTCGARLKFFGENLPILGWFMIRGHCRYCGVRVSPQYMIIELIMAVVFLGIYVVYFTTRPTTPWWGAIGGQWWYSNGVFRVWPSFLIVLFLIASLVAMTLIDARTFTIPIQVPLFVTVAAFIAYPLQAVLSHRSPASMTWPIPGTTWGWSLAAFGGMLGVIGATLLLRLGVIKYSFADYHEYVDEGETIGEYPHARREVLREVLFLLPCLLGVAGGLVLGGRLTGSAPVLVQAVGATMLGYLSGCGIVWAIRIFGTLGFGREAMGLGDVHLMGAVGAVLGWFDPLLIFFVAPFSGLLWVLVSKGLSSVFRTKQRELPYGPHLALATILVIFGRPGWDWLAGKIAPGVPLPKPGLVIVASVDQRTDGLVERHRSLEVAAENLTVAQRSWKCPQPSHTSECDTV